MILHCAPPYRYDIPNAAVGYLKGFLEAKDIKTKNVYWNLVLFQEIMNWEERMRASHPLLLKFDFFYTTTTYVCSRLLMEPCQDRNSGKTPLDTFFSSFLTQREISELITSVKNKIDWYIHSCDLCEDPLSGFTLKSHQWLMSLYIIRQLKEMNPAISIVIGGLTNEDQARTYMNVFTHADFAIWGEGEYPLYHLAEAIEKGTDLNKVPQLVYRDDTRIVSTQKESEVSDLDSYPFADHTDYFAELKRAAPGITHILIPIWGSRSCPWNKCKFCVDNEEYSYRVRSPENIVKEIEFQAQEHGIDTFTFVDSELPGNKKRFKALLKLLLQLSASRKEPYHFFGEVSPVFIDPETTRDMSLASFMSIQTGFEAMTDSLLEKMAKRHRFAHNIQALKLGSRYSLKIGGLNILRGIPTESQNDIFESCINVKFLRFLLNAYVLGPSNFVLYKGAPFYSEMSHEEKKIWNYNLLWKELVSIGLIPESDRFDFFGFLPQMSHNGLWSEFEMLLKFYKEQDCSYTWFEYENGSFIEERGMKTYGYTLDRDETDVLIFCDLIKSFSEVKERFSYLNEEKILTIMSDLKSAGLLYYDKEMRTIISVLDASRRESAWNAMDQ